ncbi:MAG TPA: membrane dipeptidase [Anaerolineaceae bacterium]|nr:membrane dipeptidase [Anaerolineaceae bacterium]
MNWFIDAHEDLAWNMACFGRDYSRSAFQTRRTEQGTPIPAYTGDTMLGWPEYNQAKVALIFGTLFVTPARPGRIDPLDTQYYASPAEANRLAWNQLGSYRRLCEQKPHAFRLIGTQTELTRHLTNWLENPPEANGSGYLPVGLIPLMEGAEGILSLDELPRWWDAGLRIIGPAWAGTRFCGGTHEPGPLTTEGKALLNAMAELGFILDLSHMDAAAAFQALESYEGIIITSHANASRPVQAYSGNRLLDDDLIRAMFERDVVIGTVPFNNFLKADWGKSGGRQTISLSMLADQIDYLCQMAGDAAHVGIGTDFDGGFGLQSSPKELDSIADLPKLLPFLSAKGYAQSQLEAIAHGNFLRVLQSALPR